MQSMNNVAISTTLTAVSRSPYHFIYKTIRRLAAEESNQFTAHLVWRTHANESTFWEDMPDDVRLCIAAAIVRFSISSSVVGETQVNEDGSYDGQLSRDDLWVIVRRFRKIVPECEQVCVALEAGGPLHIDLLSLYLALKEAALGKRCSQVCPPAQQENVEEPDQTACTACDEVDRKLQPAIVPQTIQSSLLDVLQNDAREIESRSPKLEAERKRVRVVDPVTGEVDPCLDISGTPLDETVLRTVVTSIQDPLALPGSTRIGRTIEEIDEQNVPRPFRDTGKPQKKFARTEQPECIEEVDEVRRKKPFTQEEDDAIFKGIGRFPAVPGRFTEIFHAYRNVWSEGRTVTQIYDHWRTKLKAQIRK